MYQLGVCTPIF